MTNLTSDTYGYSCFIYFIICCISSDKLIFVDYTCHISSGVLDGYAFKNMDCEVKC